MQISSGSKIFIKNKKTGRFLFILRDDIETIPYPNCWSIVGGGIEKGETPMEALKREIKEEINIKVYNIKFIEERLIKFKFKREIKKVKGYLFIGYADDDKKEIEVYEGQKARYFTLEEIIKMRNISLALKKALKKYRKLLERF